MITTNRPPLEFIRAADEAAECRASARSVLFLEIPLRRYLAIDGDAPPGSEPFRQAIASLFGVAYGLHFRMAGRDRKHPIGHLHGLYWIGDPDPLPAPSEGDDVTGPMRWRLLIAVPDGATEDEIAAAIRRQAEGATVDQPLPRVMTWEEGRVAQLMHVGPYDAEQPTLDRMRAAIDAFGLLPHGCHHEIYLSGPRTAPERTRTILRQPVAA